MSAATEPRSAQRAASMLALGAAAFIIYGSWLPLQFENLSLAALIDGLQHLDTAAPRWADALTNIVVYVPLAVLLSLRGALAGRSVPSRIAETIAWSAVVIALSEVGQIFLPIRVASAVDMGFNGLGVALGLALTPAVSWSARLAMRRLQRQARVHPLLAAFWIVTALIVIAKTAPFDLTIHAEDFRRSVGAARWVPSAPLERTTDSTVLQDVVDVAGSFFVFVMAGLLGGLGMRQAGEPTAWSIGVTAARLAFIALAIEIAQLVIGSHTCDMADALTYMAGAMLGAYLGATVADQSWDPSAGLARNSAGRLLLSTALVVQVTLITVYALPGDGRWVTPTPESIQWVPFYSQFQVPFDQAVGHIVSSWLWYLTLAGLAAAMLPSRSGRYTLCMSSALTVGLVTIMEGLQAFTVSHRADVTEPLLALVAAVAATAAWRGLIILTEPPDGHSASTA